MREPIVPRGLLWLQALLLVAGCGPAGKDEPARSASDVAPAAPSIRSAARPAPGPGMSEMKVVFVNMNPSGGVVVLLQEKEDPKRIVSMIVGEAEGTAIALRLNRRKFERPLTHDLFDELLRRLGASVLKLEIDDLRNGMFLARLFISDAAGQVFEMDSRPSDGLALALGADAPIYMAISVIENATEPPPSLSPDAGPTDPGRPESERNIRNLEMLIKRREADPPPPRPSPPQEGDR